MTAPYRYNLFSLVQALRRHLRFLLIVTLVAAVLGLVFSFFRIKEYEAKAEFLVRNPFYNDRSALYGTDIRQPDYFATDDEMNRVVALLQADSIQDKIISEMNLARAYRYDTTDNHGRLKLRKYFNDNLTIWRTENKSVELAFIDRDPVRAARVANRALSLLSETLQDFYSDTRISMHQTITRKIAEHDSAIIALTDTLVRMREEYGIYDIISPSRHNIMLSSMHNTGKPGYARGLEEIQNVESIKDQLVTDRSRQLSIAGQYSTAARQDALPLIHVVKAASPPFRQKGMGRILMTISCGFLGFVFGSFYVLIARTSGKNR